MGVIRASVVSQDKERSLLFPTSPADTARPRRVPGLGTPACSEQSASALLFLSLFLAHSVLESQQQMSPWGPTQSPMGRRYNSGGDRKVGETVEWGCPSQNSGLSQSLGSSPKSTTAQSPDPGAGRAQRKKEKHAFRRHSGDARPGSAVS